jgi:hypothetical protein
MRVQGGSVLVKQDPHDLTAQPVQRRIAALAARIPREQFEQPSLTHLIDVFPRRQVGPPDLLDVICAFRIAFLLGFPFHRKAWMPPQRRRSANGVPACRMMRNGYLVSYHVCSGRMGSRRGDRFFNATFEALQDLPLMRAIHRDEERPQGEKHLSGGCLSLPPADQTGCRPPDQPWFSLKGETSALFHRLDAAVGRW